MQSYCKISLLLLLNAVILAAIPGCGNDNPLGRLSINGVVTLDGAPLDQGMIQFSPTSKEGVSAGAVIKDGKYSIAALKGLPPGQYVVRINSSMPAPPSSKSNPDDDFPPLGIERISAAYNAKTKLSVEILPSHKEPVNFDTKSK